MEAINQSLFYLLTIANFFCCVMAVIRMYNYFRPGVNIPRFFRSIVHCWIVSLLIFAISQSNVVVSGDLGLAFTLKLGVLIFALFSMKFGRIATYLRENT